MLATVKELLDVLKSGGALAVIVVGLAIAIKFIWPVLLAQFDKNAALTSKISEDAQSRVSEAQQHMADMATEFRDALSSRDKLNAVQWEHSASLMQQMIRVQEKILDRLDRIPQK